MTEDELAEWLVEVSLNSELKKLSLATVLLELDNVIRDPSLDDVTFDWPRLILAASIAARSDKRAHKEASLRIATGAVLLSTPSAVRDAAAVLFEKLSNHRSAALAEQRGRVSPGLESRLGTALRIEDQRRRLESSILLQSSGDRLDVNEFQLQFWSAAVKDEAWLSISAPTASGKTYLVLKWLVDSLGAEDLRCAVYIAPTRALVSEIESSLVEILAQSSVDAEVTSMPSSQKYDALNSGRRKFVLVFTQERLHLLANQKKNQINIDLLIVDEAHKIGDAQRGVILQDAIERVLRSCPNMRVVFVSPATQNPEVLLEDAPESTPTRAVNSDIATVLQNVVVAQQVPAKPKEWALQLRYGSEYLPIGTLIVENKPNNLKKRLAFIAASIGQRGGTLVYTNGAAEAEEVALLISQLTERSEVVDQELADLAELARKCVHKSYMLAPLVERGVGFHYGNMPTLVRMEIERLFKNGKLKFLVCTSTLIEGVNLSCRTIVVRGPTKGKNIAMKPQDFWNLAGRAGRWGNEFQGNIICIDASDERVWPGGVPPRTRYPIRRETDAALSKLDDLTAYIADRSTTNALDRQRVRAFEQVSAYFIAAYVRDHTLDSTPWANRVSVGDLRRLEDVLAATTAGINVNAEVGARSSGVCLFGLDKLLAYFRDYPGKTEDLLLAPSESDDAYQRIARIMRRVNDHVLPAFIPDTLIPLHAVIVLEWMRGFSLPTMIRKRIDYLQRAGESVDTAKVIRQTLELIEGTARFLAPRYFSAYVDVLNQHLKEIGRDDLIDDGLDIGVALELGVTSITMRSLMELGLSRISAVALYEVIAQDDLDEAGCIEWLINHRAELGSVGLAAVVVREVEEKLRVKSQRGVTTNGQTG